MGCKIAQQKEDRVQNHTISKKIGGKGAIKHKDGVQSQKGSKKIGCKIAKKKMGCKIVQLAKDRGKSAIKPFSRIYLRSYINYGKLVHNGVCFH
jgi:hypothetical protein